MGSEGVRRKWNEFQPGAILAAPAASTTAPSRQQHAAAKLISGSDSTQVRQLLESIAMSAVWLKTNRRAVLLGMVFPAAIFALGMALVLSSQQIIGQSLGGLALCAGGVLFILLLAQLRQPRLAYEPGYLLVYLQAGGPIRVPIDIVECFLLGQAPSMLAGQQHERTETASVMIRLSEKAEEWSHRSVKPALGKWCDGYITIRGTWCEPLTIQVINRLNQRLAEAHRQWRSAQVAS